MDLDWSKQIYILNKLLWIGDGKLLLPRWILPYIEFLFPKMEGTLLYANVTEEMCNKWMAIIVDTFCKRSGIASGQSLNLISCTLANIPHMWLRTQTARATELICSLNSVNSASGISTLARLCAFTKTSTGAAASSVLEKRKKFPTTNEFRLGPTLKHLKDLGVRIVSSSQQESADVLSVVHKIKATLEQTGCMKAIVYTDGSTSLMGKSPNSGCGIFITDEKHIQAAVVRTDGNNFIAELAAAAIVVKARPRNHSLLLRIDSMATIGAIAKDQFPSGNEFEQLDVHG